MRSNDDFARRSGWMWGLAGSVVLALCASSAQGQTPGVAAPAVQGASGDTEFKIIDARRAEDRRFSWLSRFIGSCNFGIASLGDEQAPDRIKVLETQLEAKFGIRLKGHALLVERYGIYVNAQDAGRSSAIGVGIGGAIGANIAAGQNSHSTGSHCPKEKMSGGWIGPSEATTPFDPYVAEIDAVIDGAHVSARAVYSPTKWMGRCGGYDRKACYTGPAMLEQIAGIESGAGNALADQLGDRLTR